MQFGATDNSDYGNISNWNTQGVIEFRLYVLWSITI